MPEPVHLVYCHCAYSDVVPAAVRGEVFAGLSSSGVKFHAVADLCELAARGDAMLTELADGRPVRIAACYERAVRSLLAWSGATILDLKVLNMRELPAEAVLAGMLADCDGMAANAAAMAPGSCDLQNMESCTAGTAVPRMGETPMPLSTPPQPTGKWPPWFPVIDQQRCVQCGQCQNFCLFGVYERIDGKVRVTNPDKCKNNCPACARVCPAAAIIFPKYPDSPINGDEVRPEDLRQQKMQTNLSAVANGDVYSMLRNRSPLAKAIQERAKAQQAQQAPAPGAAESTNKQDPPAHE